MKKYEPPSLMHAVFFIILVAYLTVSVYFYNESFDKPFNLWFTPFVFIPTLLQTIAKKLRLNFFVTITEVLEFIFLLPSRIIAVGPVFLLSHFSKIPENEERFKTTWFVGYIIAILFSVSSIWVDSESLRILLLAGLALSILCLVIFFYSKRTK